MSYKGAVVEIPLGLDGLNGSRNTSQIPATQLTYANNLTFEGGTIQKAGGADKYNSTAISGTPTIYGGWDWWPTEATQRMVVLAGTSLLKDDGTGAFATTLASGLTAATTPVFAEGGKEAAANNRKLFIATGTNQLKVLAADGATVANVATPPADWTSSYPTVVCEHDGRMWGAGNSNDPHRLYYSILTNHEDFTSTGSGSISVYPGVGGPIKALASYRGRLIVWKERGIFVLDTTTITSPVLDRKSASTGIANPTAWCAYDNDILFLDQNAQLHILSSVQEYDDVATRNVGDINEMNQWIRDNTLSAAYLSTLRLVSYPRKREVQMAMTSTGGTANNLRLTLDFSKQGQMRFHTSYRDVPISLWAARVSGEQTLYMGSTGGFVWRLDRTTKTKDGSAYTAELKTAPTDLRYADESLGAKNKLGDFLELVFEPVGNWTVDVSVYWDGELECSVSFTMGTEGSTLGAFVLDSDVLAGDSVLSQRRRITGSGKYINLVCSASGASQDFSLARAYLYFTTGDENTDR